MELQKATQNDFSNLMTLYSELVPFSLAEADCAERFSEICQREDMVLLCAKEGEQVLGTALGICCTAVTGDFLVIEDVITAEFARGQGVGKVLLTALEQWGREQGCLYSILVSSGFRKEAHRFYEKVGYTEEVRGFRKMLFPDCQ